MVLVVVVEVTQLLSNPDHPAAAFVFKVDSDSGRRPSA